MDPSCDHDFDETAAVFTGTVRARTCRKCQRIEVMLYTTGAWVTIDDYLERRVANRSGAA